MAPPPESVQLSQRVHGDTLILFDVDGTLAIPAQPAKGEIVEMLSEIRKKYAVGIVGAGDFEKQQMQLGGPDLRSRLDFVFSENGVHAFRGQEQLHCKSIQDHLGQVRWTKFQEGMERILAAEREEAERLMRLATQSPEANLAERGTFLELRQCTVNVCPIGRTPTMTKEQRAAFDGLDRESGMRRRVLSELQKEFGSNTEYKLVFSIGGQIGIDVCPLGWDKTFCLQFVDDQEFRTVHFFGDKTEEGGGDHELYIHPRTTGHMVTSPEDTLRQVYARFLGEAQDNDEDVNKRSRTGYPSAA
jgi:phosphomannomutase